ncbi:hypothetical protein ACH4SK_14220 [Streptomyces inhibens]|uniref:hypothetical protein n=1 Tax=Streptomyces inhibens TaxID=2293571 RepID=UPI00378F3036
MFRSTAAGRGSTAAGRRTAVVPTTAVTAAGALSRTPRSRRSRSRTAGGRR